MFLSRCFANPGASEASECGGRTSLPHMGEVIGKAGNGLTPSPQHIRKRMIGMTDIIVVGAGSAGMMTALQLSTAGADVTVLEARSRLGGRTWSDTLSNGEVAERGGEYFDSSMTDVTELIEELGLSMTSQGFNPSVRATTHPDGPSLDDLESSSRQAADYWRSLNDVGDEASIQDIIDGAGLEPELARILSARISCGRAADVSLVSAKWSDGPASLLVSHEHNTRILGGNQQISERIADRIGRDRIKTRWPVASVSRDGGGYVVTGMSGMSLAARAVVFAVPVSLLGDIEIEGLDAGTRAAIAKMGFGQATKLHLTVENQCDPGIWQNVDLPYSTWATQSAVPGEARFVTGFAATRGTQEKLSVADGPVPFRAQLESDWAGVQFGKDGLLTYWGGDPWARGAYSYRPVRWSKEDEVAISAPSGGVFFAGEHTTDIHRSTICGAIRSGKRVAREVLERFGG